MRMNNYIRNLIIYFENVLHPAAGWADNLSEKKKRKAKKNIDLKSSPECFNIRGGSVKKQDKLRPNPAP